LGDYPSKHHSAHVHQHVRPYYVHEANSPSLLPRAAKPSSRRGCTESLGSPYTKTYPLPSIPGSREPTRGTSVHSRERTPTTEQTLPAHKPWSESESRASMQFPSSRLRL
jgi:hypothetical protein